MSIMITEFDLIFAMTRIAEYWLMLKLPSGWAGAHFRDGRNRKTKNSDGDEA